MGAVHERDPFAEEPVPPAIVRFPSETHDEIDALKVERNSAVAEAKLWLARLHRAQRERNAAVSRANLAAWNSTEWQQAYEELLREHLRLQAKYTVATWEIESLEILHEHLYPLAMAQLQALIDKAPE